eukprot:CAMPEP_0167750844 /NCGR_PEP_ID=MMETSP0110_2-20121227/6217_1 /TAXON_ID=629695 /ORGANISM="Gymnochlora sp., Strain CCMP2014" /LENGTH=739 /DNA_ID=CAMNT_0007636211 /DNA_START=9 /DNA_END=2228 /DNA_ORIENTATION=+
MNEGEIGLDEKDGNGGIYKVEPSPKSKKAFRQKAFSQLSPRRNPSKRFQTLKNLINNQFTELKSRSNSSLSPNTSPYSRAKTESAFDKPPPLPAESPTEPHRRLNQQTCVNQQNIKKPSPPAPRMPLSLSSRQRPSMRPRPPINRRDPRRYTTQIPRSNFSEETPPPPPPPRRLHRSMPTMPKANISTIDSSSSVRLTSSPSKVSSPPRTSSSMKTVKEVKDSTKGVNPLNFGDMTLDLSIDNEEREGLPDNLVKVIQKGISTSLERAKGPSRPASGKVGWMNDHQTFFSSSGDTLFEFRSFRPKIFSEIRNWFDISNEDVELFLGEKSPAFTGGISKGKSRSFIYFSTGKRFVLKTMNQTEVDFVRRSIPSYLEHIKRNPNTLLSRFLGLYRIRLIPPSAVNREVGVMSQISQASWPKLNFVVINNVFNSPLEVNVKFDLKGSTAGRKVRGKDFKKRRLQSMVFKDLDFLGKNADISEDAADKKDKKVDPPQSTTRTLTPVSSPSKRAFSEPTCEPPSPQQLAPSLPRVKASSEGAEMNLSSMSSSTPPAPPPRKSNDIIPKAQSVAQRKIFIAKTIRLLLLEQLKQDVKWLTAHNIMDYSFLCGICLKPPPAESKSSLGRGPRTRTLIPLKGPMSASKQEKLKMLATSNFERKKSEDRKKHQGSIFEQNFGGVRSSGGSQDLVYFFGVIDICQEYNLRKLAESGVRGLLEGASKISSIPPQSYAQRFLDFISRITST